jgi:hypothetical protein
MRQVQVLPARSSGCDSDDSRPHFPAPCKSNSFVAQLTASTLTYNLDYGTYLVGRLICLCKVACVFASIPSSWVRVGYDESGVEIANSLGNVVSL